MRNLAGVDTPICDALLRVELTKAGVPAFTGEAIQRREVPATAIGAITYAGGVQATFYRCWYYWGVSLSKALPYEPAKQLNDQWGSQVRIDGYSGGKDPSPGGVYSYNVDTQEGLNALVAVLNTTFGMTFEVDPRDIKTPDWLRPMSLTKLPDFADKAAQARAEVAALNALGGYLNRYEYRESVCEEALAIATAEFGPKGHETHGMRVVVANLYRDQARRLKMLIPTLSDDTSVFCYTADLEHILTKRVPLLFMMGRRKEARSVKRECEDVRFTLAGIYRSRKELEEAKLAETAEGKPDDVAYARHRVALTLVNMTKLLKRMKRHDEAATLMAELQSIYPLLDDHRRADIDERLANK